VSWKNDDLVLYHGCSTVSLQPGNPQGIALDTPSHGINHTTSRQRLDFGPGFYTTTWLYQARLWANERQIRDAKGHSAAKAVVLRIEMRRNDLADLQCLGFVDWKRGGWLSFIEYCRAGGRPHAPKEYRSHPYDVVYGPLSGSKDHLSFGEADQLSFHTEEATKKIPIVSVHELGGPLLPLGDP
jgi:hypothetical protein